MPFRVTDNETGKVITFENKPTEADIQEAFGVARGGTGTQLELGVAHKQPPAQRSWLERASQTLADVTGDISKQVKQTLPSQSGLLGGGLMGSLAAANPYIGLLGAGLGYAGGKQVERMLQGDTGSSLIDQLLRTGKETVQGSAMEAGGQAAGAALAKGVNAIDPARMYERVAKFSTTLKPAERLRRVQTALREDIPLTKEGLAKSKALVSDINDRINQRIAEVADEPVDMGKIWKTAEQKMIDKAMEKTKPFYQSPVAQVEETAGMFREGASVNPETISQAHQYKVNINRELDDFYKALQASPDKTTQLSKMWVPKTKAALADELRQEIYTTFPEVGQLSQREASLIQLNKSLERAVNRIGNRDLWSLKSIGAFIRHPKWALMEYVVNNPEVQSSLAIAVNKAQKYGVPVSKDVELATKIGAVASQEDKPKRRSWGEE